MDELDQALSHLDGDRRAFLKKLAVGTAFAVPVVSSFTMSGIGAAYAQTAASSAQVRAGNATAGQTTTSPATTTSQPTTNNHSTPTTTQTTTTFTSPNSTTTSSSTTTSTTSPNQPSSPAPAPGG
jgi:hypothetical protein